MVMRMTQSDRHIRAALITTLLVGGCLVVMLAAMGPARAQTSPIVAYFTDNVAATVITTTATPLEAALLDLINASTTSIDLAIYDFSRESIRDALIAAHARGVAVRVVGDNKARGALGSRANFDMLEAAGIPVVVDGVVPTATIALAQMPAELFAAAPDETLQSLIMHDKYFIVDKRWVWTGSVNMSDSDITLNHNNALEIDSPALAALYQGDFDQMFGGAFGTDKVAVVTHTVEISGTLAQVYFAPQDIPIEQVIAAVNGAQRSVDFAIFTFTDDALADALIAAQARGVRVRGLWDSLAAGNTSADDERMCAAGLSIKIENTRGLMHNKMLVIDAQGDAPEVVTGSLNWTAGGNNGNNENTLVIKSGALTQQYADAYQKLWTEIAVEPCNPESAVSWNVRMPIVFNDAAAPTPTPLPKEPTPTSTPSPTATATPTSTPTSTVESAVHISRIVYNPPGDDLAGELVELANDGQAAAQLEAWTLVDAAKTPNVYTFPAFELAPGSVVRVWVKPGVDAQGDLFWGRGQPVWNNDGDRAMVRDGAGVVVAECAYEPATGEALCP